METAGARFSKVQVTSWVIKDVLFSFKMGVSKNGPQGSPFLKPRKLRRLNFFFFFFGGGVLLMPNSLLIDRQIELM